VKADSGRPDPPHLQRALDALAVAGRQPRAVTGSTCASSACSAGQPFLGGASASSCGAHRGVGRGHVVQAVEQRLEIQHGAAHQQRQAAAPRISPISAVASRTNSAAL
jgi:hypothetical protein